MTYTALRRVHPAARRGPRHARGPLSPVRMNFREDAPCTERYDNGFDTEEPDKRRTPAESLFHLTG